MSNRIGNRDDELQAFKKINLSVIASAYGFVVDKKETTRHTTMMRRDNEKIGITQKNGVYLFASNRDQDVAGTAIEFVAQFAEPGANLGRVRQILRPFMGGAHLTTVLKDYKGKYVKDIRGSSSEIDYLGIATRIANFPKIEGHNDYLCNERAIPASLLEHPRVKGRVRWSDRGSLIFPHYGTPDNNPQNPERALCGYEIKGNVSMFSKGGRKGLFASAGFATDNILAVSESGVDGLSYLALHGAEDTRVVSIAGQLNDYQPELLKAAIGKMKPGSTIVGAFDADAAGDKFCEALMQIVGNCGRSDIDFRDHRPERGQDWNQVLKNKSSLHDQSYSVPRSPKR